MKAGRFAQCLLAGLCSLSLGAWTCTLGPGVPTDPDGSVIHLGVPWFLQVYPETYCGAASIEMWAAYHGNQVSQFTIASYIGATQYSAEQMSQTVQGAIHFTGIPDLYLDWKGGTDSQIADFLAKEVASVNDREPLLIEFLPWHRVLVSGGKWTRDRVNDRRVWDYVYYNDPEVTSDLQMPGGVWKDSIGGHIISNGATTNWSQGLQMYGPSVWFRLSRTRIDKEI